eukprot:CAMPEP_0194346744 /NCGR_PEP_ID=MMETSP0171-20130528/105598_1 /TAXON_ID=218684 /ORGANISM="Corethron pennatum, Strain L29A3" /LENGTH=800 /DNA_ID=CAMNT_0039113905 /DNA_START=87 /DNA_END=2490 /DNA_ORIENTATION=-
MIESQEQDSIKKTTDDESLPDEENMSLSEDTYGLLLILSPKSAQFWKTFVIAVFQVALIVMISINLLESDIGDPLFNPPTGISTQVFVGQIMALIIGVFAQNDITESIELLVYSPVDLASNLKVSPMQVLIINLLHFSVGIGGLFIVFVVVVQSTDIVGLFAEFAAMEFISHIDELFFLLASQSYVGRDLCIATEEMKNIKIPSSIQGRSAKKILLFFPMIITFAGWGWVQRQLLTGKYLEPFFTVFIPDDFNVNDSYLSGVYAPTKCHSKRRFSYVNKKIVNYNDEDENVSVRGVISYCSESETWVLNSYLTAKKVENVCFELANNEIYDPCKRILLQSPRTKKYNINEISPKEWFMKSSEGGFVPVPSFFNYVSNECQEDRDCSVLRNDKYGGTCNKDTNTCDCTGGRFGKSCEYSKPCAIQHETYFSFKENQYIGEDFENVNTIINKTEDETEPFLFNDHPVYFQSYEDEGIGWLVFYQGVRFIQRTCNKDTNTCDCTGGRFGKSCEYSKPCAIHHETSFSLKENQYNEGGQYIEENFENVATIINKIEDETEPFLYNNHPVYFQSHEGWGGFLIFYQGVRFIQHGIDDNEWNVTDLDADIINDDVVGFFSNDTVKILFPWVISEQTDAGSPDGSSSIFSIFEDEGIGWLVFYQGVRFIQHYVDLNELNLTDVDVDIFNDLVVEYLSNDTIPILPPTFISEQTDAGSPDGLEWYEIITDAGKVTKTKGGGFGKLALLKFQFICPECSLVGNRCGNGQCNNGTCVCEEGYNGSLCQIPRTEAPTSPPTLNLNVTGIPS